MLNVEGDLERNQQVARFANLTRSDQVYELIVKTNQMLTKLTREIDRLHKFVRDLYAYKFSELETIVTDPLAYAKTVKELGNYSDITQASLGGILSNTAIMSINVAASHSGGKNLPEQDLKKVVQGCEDILYLEECRQKLLKYLEDRMHFIAPNLSEVVGTSIAAKLIAATGGIESLAKIPAGNIQVIGSQRKHLHGLSSASAGLHRGFVAEHEIVVNAPKNFKMQAIRILSTNAAKAARIDACRTDPSGQKGKQIMEEKILKRFGKIQEPQQPRLRNPLPKPDDKPRKKRAGKKF